MSDVLPDFSQRELIPELMDDPAVDVHDLFPSLKFLEAVNLLPGAASLIVQAARETFRARPAGQPLTLLDVGAGGGDVALRLARELAASGWPTRVIGLDYHQRTLDYARGRIAGSTSVSLIRGDALSIPLPDASVDFAYSTLFLHHLDDEQAVQSIREMNRVSRNGVAIADLVRSAMSYVGVKLVTYFANRVAAHDGPVSVRRSFTVPELEAAGRTAGLTAPRVSSHVPFRILLRSAAPAPVVSEGTNGGTH